MDTAHLVLEYLKVFLAAPFMAATVVVIAFFLFKEDIKGLLRRIAKIKLPGGSEFSTSQIEKANEELPSRGQKPPANPPDQQGLPQNLSITPEQQQAVRQFLDAERANARLWEYRYLNYFLARSSQRVLDWLASLTTRTTVAFLDTYWLPLIPNAEERRAIVNALQAHYLILIDSGLIEVTPKGREYLQWRGPLSTEAN